MTPDALDIYNFRRLSPTLTTSGQPSEDQFAALAGAGVTTVINLALADSPRALPDQAGVLASLGLRYVHIPVEFAAPARADFSAFAAAMDAAGGETVHVHCVANYRVSAFLYRYRVERLGWAPSNAEPDLKALWEPDEIWRKFLSGG